jgi:hypothetical protein
MSPVARIRLGHYAGLATRYSVFRTEAALEIDEKDHFEVRRKRVFFDDILLVTHHRDIGTAFCVVNALVALICWTFAFIFLMSGSSGGVIAFSCLAAPSTLAVILRLTLRVDVVTVFGRRSKAILRYTFRKRFARETFADLCERARAAQQRVADEIAASVPIATPDEVPPSPAWATLESPPLSSGAALEEMPPSPPPETPETVHPLPAQQDEQSSSQETDETLPPRRRFNEST